MLPAANRGEGLFVAAPDVCRTPPVGKPVPYVDVAFNALAAFFAPNVLTSMMPTLTLTSVIPLSTGDNAGTMHWTFMGAAVVTGCFFPVLINNLPAATLCSLTAGNNFNAPRGLIALPSLTNVFIGLAAEGSPPDPSRPLGADEATRVELSLAGLPLGGPDGRGAMVAPGIGLVSLRVVSLDAPTRMYRAIRELTALGMRALVVDLRDNPGGDVAAALELAGDFVAPGTPLVVQRDADGDETLHHARGTGQHHLPLVLLVDESTASAAEILAGCLRACGRAVLVGAGTYGKGIGQRLSPARDGQGVLAASPTRFTLPGGVEIHGVGVKPDVEAEPGRALDAAISVALRLADGASEALRDP